MSKMEITPELKEAAVKFYKENSSKDEKSGVYSVNQTAYTKFLKDQGLPEEVQKKINQVRSAVIYGGTEFLKEKLAEAIEEAKTSGTDPKTVKVTVRTRTNTGSVKLVGHAHRQYVDPKDPKNKDARIDAYGVVEMKVSDHYLVDEAHVDALSEHIKSLM